MRLNPQQPREIQPAVHQQKAEPFSAWATVTYALLAFALLMYTMRTYWTGNRLQALWYPANTAAWVTTVDMLLYSGMNQLSSSMTKFSHFVIFGQEDVPRRCAKILRETADFVATNDARAAAKLRAELIVLLAETGSTSKAFNLVQTLDDPEALNFRAGFDALYGTNSLSTLTSFSNNPPFTYLESSWPAWRFKSRWSRATGKVSHARWYDDWIAEQARRKIALILFTSTISLSVMVVGVGLLFLLFHPGARSRFGPLPPSGFSLREGVGIFVRAYLFGSVLCFLCCSYALTWVACIARGVLMTAPLLLIIAYRHWRHGASSLVPLLRMPHDLRLWLMIIAGAVCIVGINHVGWYGIAEATRAVGLESHWTEGLDEALIYDSWPTQLVVLLNAVVWYPIFEELAFRGVLFPTLRDRFGVFPGALASSLIFAATHLYTFPGFLSVTLLGFLCALISHYTRSLIPCILGHSFNNFLYYSTQVALFSF